MRESESSFTAYGHLAITWISYSILSYLLVYCARPLDAPGRNSAVASGHEVIFSFLYPMHLIDDEEQCYPS